MVTSAPELTKTEADAIIAAAPMATAPALPPNQTNMKSGWIPPRKVWVGGVFAILSWLIIHAITAIAGIDVQSIADSLGVDPVTTLSGIIFAAVSWITPPSVSDKITGLNDAIIHLAQRDQQSNVSYALPAVRPPIGSSGKPEPATIALAKAA